MYEDETNEKILERMLNRIPNYLDKSESSLSYIILSSVAVELAQGYINANNIINQTFADTANRIYLIKRAKERGRSPKEATKAIVKGEFNIDIEIGSRFSCGTLNYIVIEKVSTCIYKLECETAGTIGNSNIGKLIPIEYISGLETANITELLIPGEDEEDTEVFRTKYFNSFKAVSYGGNETDYIEKVTSIAGVGGCKPVRITRENGDIDIYIIDGTYRAPNISLISSVQEIIDPENDGNGKGVAPYNHYVTIKGVSEQTINVNIDAEYDTGYSFEALKTEIINAIENEMLDLRKNWKNEEYLVVRTLKLKSDLLDVVGIVDIRELKLNDQVNNIILGAYEIPILGEVTND